MVRYIPQFVTDAFRKYPCVTVYIRVELCQTVHTTMRKMSFMIVNRISDNP